jgi:hypothetical protein
MPAMIGQNIRRRPGSRNRACQVAP